MNEMNNFETGTVNLTPHPINIYHTDGKTLVTTVPVSDYVARVGSAFSPMGTMIVNGKTVSTGKVVYDKNEMYCVLRKEAFGKDKVANPAKYPLPEMEEGKTFIVSVMMTDLRDDFVSPGDAVRNEQGHTIGCIGLSV